MNERFQKQQGQSGPEFKGQPSVKVCGERFVEGLLKKKGYLWNMVSPQSRSDESKLWLCS